MRSRTAHNGRNSVLIKCINCLHTASSSQDFSTMLLRNPSRVATNTPSRHSGVPKNPSHRLLPQRAPFITPTIRWASTRSLRTLAISSLTSTLLGFPYPPPIFFTRYDHNATTSHRRTRQSFLLSAPTARFIHGTYTLMGVAPLFHTHQPTSLRLASTAGPFLADSAQQPTSLRLASSAGPFITDSAQQSTSIRLASAAGPSPTHYPLQTHPDFTWISNSSTQFLLHAQSSSTAKFPINRLRYALPQSQAPISPISSTNRLRYALPSPHPLTPISPTNRL